MFHFFTVDIWMFYCYSVDVRICFIAILWMYGYILLLLRGYMDTFHCFSVDVDTFHCFPVDLWIHFIAFPWTCGYISLLFLEHVDTFYCFSVNRLYNVW